ncbi:MAG: sugar ABC transporter permease [Gemmataceae bacterium]|nr:sugar ABC transporter permease [Gemmataceae bacterium]
MAFLAPSLVYFGVFKLYPMTQAALISLFDYDLLSPPRYVGLSNYTSLISDPVFHHAIVSSFSYVLGVAAPVWVLALALALVFNRPGRVRSVFQVLYFVPAVSSIIVAAIVWKFLFHPQGLVNALLGGLGVDRINWLTSIDTAMLALIIAGIWRTVPYFMVIYLASLKGVPTDYYEAAALDGANTWQGFRYITVPLLRPTIALVVVVSVILTLRHFINPMLMTGGGPAGATRVLPLLIYETGFQFSRMGLASAMSMVFFLMVMVFTIVQLRLFHQMGQDR